MWAAETVQGRGLRSQNGLTVRSSRPGSGVGGRPGWAAGHPYAAAGGGIDGGSRCLLAGGVNQLGRPRQVMGVMTCTTRADQGKAEGGAHATLGRCSDRKSVV